MNEAQNSGRSIFNLTLGLILIGTVGVAVLKSGLDPIAIVFWRSTIATVFLLVWCFATGILPDRSITKRNLLVGLIAGASLVLSWAAFFAGIILTTITTATIIMHIQPFFILLLGALLWKETVTRDQLLWLTAAFVGVVLASGLSLSAGAIDHRWMTGVAITFGGAMLYAVTAVAGKALKDQRGEITTLCQTVVGVVIFAPFVNFHQAIALPGWGWLAVIGVVQTGIAWVLIYSALPRVSTPLIAVLSFVNPLTAITTDWLFFGRVLGLAQGAGLVLILVSTLGVKLGWRLPFVRRLNSV
ncbi:MAG: DMT family transporter [Pseudomonadota bacterium]